MSAFPTDSDAFSLSPDVWESLSWLLDFYQRLTGPRVAYIQCVCQMREVHSQHSRLSGPSTNKSLKSPLPSICSGVPAQTESQTSAGPGPPWPTATALTTASTKLPSPTLLQPPGILAASQRSQAVPFRMLGLSSACVGRGNSFCIFPSYFLTSFKSVQKSLYQRSSLIKGLNKIVPYSYITRSSHPFS